MAGNRACSVYIGNLDERVSDRVLYDILIQAGRVVDLHIPRDKETDRPKGYAFAEYETEEVAKYAVMLFSGLVTIYNRTLRFAISGQDKPSLSLLTTNTPTSNTSLKVKPEAASFEDMEMSRKPSLGLSTACRFSDYHSQVPVLPGVINHYNGRGSNLSGYNYDYSRRVLGATLGSITSTRSGRYDTSNPITYSYH